MSTYSHHRVWLGRTIYILVALSSIFCTLVAQSNPGRRTYSGVVLDATSQEPLIGASLWVEELHQGVATDADGAFTLSLPTNGEYHIKVSYVGYKDYTFRYSSKRASQAPQRILLLNATAELNTVRERASTYWRSSSPCAYGRSPPRRMRSDGLAALRDAV